MVNKRKRKRRLKKSLARRCKEIKKYQIESSRSKADQAIRKMFIKAGIL